MKKMTKKAVEAITIDNVIGAAEMRFGRYHEDGPQIVRHYGHQHGSVIANDQRYWVRELTFRTWQFQVDDTEAGIAAVAAALGNGWATMHSWDDEATEYSKYGVQVKDNDELDFTDSRTLFFASETIGYRAVWGGVRDAYQEQLVTSDTYEEDEDGEYWGETWTVDVYNLRTGLSDGGALVQSASSQAFVAAEKEGDVWTLTLTMPVLPDGKMVGFGYHRCFKAAWKAYMKAQGK